MRYGMLPKYLGQFTVECKEMMFYQYLPVKWPGEMHPVYGKRLNCFDKLVGSICCDFIGEYGLNLYGASYIYVTAKYLYQPENCSYNRPGWHCDGFLTDDINYIWSDRNPTVFNDSEFNLTPDDTISLNEMKEQANPLCNYVYGSGALLRLNQYNVHKVADIQHVGMRTFLKISFSSDQYNLVGNSHNYLINYNWEMKDRKSERNMPQNLS